MNEAIKPKSEPSISQRIDERTKATTGPCADSSIGPPSVPSRADFTAGNPAVEGIEESEAIRKRESVRRAKVKRRYSAFGGVEVPDGQFDRAIERKADRPRFLIDPTIGGCGGILFGPQFRQARGSSLV